MGALLSRVGCRRSGCLLLQKEEGLDGIPLLLGHGLQLGLGAGRNGHGGYTFPIGERPAQFYCGA